MQTRIVEFVALAISISGLVLLIEIVRAVRWNLFWMDRAIVAEPRFSLYVGGALAIAVLIVTRGVTAREIAPLMRRAFIFIEAPLTLLVSGLLITIAHGWRMRTDVAPLDGASTDVMPFLIRVVANGWEAYGGVALAAIAVAVVFWKTFRATGKAAS